MSRPGIRFAVAIVALSLAVANCSDVGPVVDVEPAPDTVTSDRLRYDDDFAHYGFLTVPPGEGPHPVVVFIHGGFWLNSYGYELAVDQAASAVEAGFATWNIEYRRVGDPGGGYPGTLEDVAKAVDHIAGVAGEYRLDLDRVAVVGHSAGGHLAFWVGQRSLLPAGAPGAEPLVAPALVVGQAPVADLANNLDLGGGAVERFMAVLPADAPDSYAAADPAQLRPIVTPQLIVQGGADTIVPPDRADAYAELIGEPEMLEVLMFENEDHFDVIDPASASWVGVLNRLADEFA
ncbi:MAG: acetyl esterase/lipase [Candidatus Aldehydirespiratoraceae bacterium]